MKLRIKMFLTIDKEIEVTDNDPVDLAEEKIIVSMKEIYGENLVEADPYEITTEHNEKFVKKYGSWVQEVKR